MSETIPTFTIPSDNGYILRGDTWKGLVFNLSDDDTGAIDLTGATIRCAFYLNNRLIIDLSTTNGTITITNAVNGDFKINQIDRMDYSAGTLKGDLEITFADNTRETYCFFDLRIKEDRTK